MAWHTRRISNLRQTIYLPKPGSRIFFERVTPGMNGFRLAAGVGPKLEAAGAIVTQPLILFPAETHTKKEILHANVPKSNRRSRCVNPIGHITKP